MRTYIIVGSVPACRTAHGVAGRGGFIVTGIFQILLLVASLVLLLAAAVLSIFAGASGGRFFVAAAGDMDRMLGEELWGTDAIDARNYTAGLNLIAILVPAKR